MPLNIHVTKDAARDAFVRQELITLAQVTGQPGVFQKVVQIIDDEGVKPRTVRQVDWVLDSAVTFSDDIHDEDVLKATLDTLLQGAVAAASTVGGIPNPQAIVDATFRTIKSIKKIWTGEKGYALYSVRDLPVTFEERAGAALRLRATLKVDAVWITDQPSDNGNRAWFEMENLRIQPPGHQCKATGSFNVKSQTDMAGAGRGRTWFVPGSADDNIGVFDDTVGDCTAVVNSDTTRVSFDVSLTVLADSTTSVIVRKVTLLLEIVPDAPRERRGD